MSEVEVIIPNNEKSIAGKWYPLNTEFKIEEILKKDSPDVSESHYPNYKFTIKFPDGFRTGIHPKDLILMGVDEKWSCHYYGGLGEPIPEEMMRLVKQVRNLTRQNKVLQHRCISLENNFSKTRWEEEQDNYRKNQDHEKCEYCSEEINKKEKIEGIHWIYLLEEGVMHIDCAVKAFNMICQDCGIVCESDDGSCPECAGALHSGTEKELRDKLKFDVIKKYIPDELNEQVQLITPEKSH